MVDFLKWLAASAAAIALMVGLSPGLASAAESPQPWGAHDPHELDIIEPQDVIVDEVHERLFFTTFNPRLIVVTDFSGTILKEIPVPTRRTIMTLSPDGSTIWAAATDAEPVYSIDVATLEVTEALSDGCTNAAIEHNGFLISIGPCGIAVRDLADLDTVVHSLVGSEYAISEPLARIADSSDPVLVIVEMGITRHDVLTIDATTWQPIVVLPHADKPSSIQSVAVSPDGSKLLIGDFHSATRTYSLPDLVRGPDYPLPGAGGLAFQESGALVAVGNGLVRVYSPGTTTISRTLHLLPEMSPHLVGIAGDGTNTAVITLFDDTVGFTPWLHMVDTTTDAGSIAGTIRHDFAEFNGGLAPLGHVDLFNDDFQYLGTVDAESDGSYQFDEVGTGTYYQIFWNGEYGDRADDPTVLYDFFPQVYQDQPLLGPPTPIRVVSGERTSAIDASLAPLFFDMFGHTFADDIYWLGTTGITKGCDPPLNSLFCPDDSVTRGQMAAFLSRALSLPAASGDSFVDDDGSVFESAIERLAASGITKGCNPPVNDRFCPSEPVTRGQMAAFLNRVFDLPPPGHISFDDDDGSVFETQIERLAAAGITKGCNPPINDRFCPDAAVTRGQMAAFLRRAFAYAAESAAGPVSLGMESPTSVWLTP